MRGSVVLFAVVLIWALMPPGAFAQSGDTRYVTDRNLIMMRGSPEPRAQIIRQLPTGTALIVVSDDAQNGYSRVRLTTSDTEGYVLTRLLMREPDARTQVAALEAQINTLRAQSGDRGRELDDLRIANQQAAERIAALEASNQSLQNDLDELTRKSARVVAIDRENGELRTTLTDAEIEVQALRSENEMLSSQRMMWWFVLGAIVLLTGILLGLILPTLRRRRGGYRGGDLLS
ncbi:MAG: TIGR04211 family SH3 domain-containing protein [Pseudomonadota bacterium]